MTTNPTPEFQAFPKIPRLRNEMMVITEKIDGTNAQICVFEDGTVKAGSRNRWITPDDDNFGFARWVEDNKAALVTLGVGRHYGEWWGPGIQRNYGHKDKKFSLFNIFRDKDSLPACVSQVPTLYRGKIDLSMIDLALSQLIDAGSIASPGFMRPEGVVVHYPTAQAYYKRLIENDDIPKSQVA